PRISTALRVSRRALSWASRSTGANASAAGCSDAPATMSGSPPMPAKFSCRLPTSPRPSWSSPTICSKPTPHRFTKALRTMESTLTYARPELLQVADTVARDKGIDKDEVLDAMEQAIQKAGRSKYGQEYD